jgi:hypothetical protein
MKTLRQRFCVMLAALLALAGSQSLRAQPTGQWDFNSGDLSGTVGGPLQYLDGAGGATQQGTQFGTTTALGIPNIGGAEALVMRFPSNYVTMGYTMPTPATANGGGTLVNQWTLIMDILFPTNSSGKIRGLLEADAGNTPDAELFVGANNGIGAPGQFAGELKPNTWHRIAFVVDQSAGINALRTYVDGVEVGTRRAADVDGRWALAAGGTATLFTDDNDQTAEGYVNSIQLRNVALTAGQLRALGGPSAAGIPQALPPVPSFIEKWIPTKFANRTTDLGAIINAGDTTIQDSSISLTLDNTPLANPTITRNGPQITVRSANQGPFAAPSTHTLVLTYTDSASGQKSLTNEINVVLLYEDFEGLTLGPRKDEDNDATAAFDRGWTNVPPPGWTVDNSQFPAVVITDENPDADGDGFADQDGRTEWAGWSFANKDFWVAADNQNRDRFSLAQGTVAIADPDEWDDQSHLQSLFNSFLKSPPISVQGVPSNSVFLSFVSSWRPEGFDDPGASFPTGPEGEAINNQTAVVTASYDGGAPIQVLKWDSDNRNGVQGPFFHPDSENEAVLLQLNNPAGASNLVLSFEMRDAANDWWWAVDNIVVNAGSAPPIITTQPVGVDVAEGSPATLTVTATGDGLTYQWFKGTGASRVAVPGATSASYNIPAAQLDHAGVYSVDVKNASATTTSGNVRLSVLPTTTGRLVLLDENFDALALGSPVEEPDPGTNVWTKTPPTGWTVDDTGVPGVGTDQDGRTEWAGWSFANRDWWARVAGDQQRTLFTKGTGASAIADSDTWDDGGPAAGNMATYLKTKSISLAGVEANSVVLKFDSSWRPEEPQTANVTASFDGGAATEILRLDSAGASPNFRADEVNGTIVVLINNPAGATNLVVTFGYFETRNNWWWAIDNILVLGDPEGGGGGGDLTLGAVTSSNSVLTLTWTGGTAPYLIQRKSSLSDAAWVNVMTTSNTTAQIPQAGNAGFFRVSDHATTTVTLSTVRLSGAAERPDPVDTPATGVGTISIEGNTLTYLVSFSGLKQAASNAHIHGPADANTPAGVIVGLTFPTATSGVLSGTIDLSTLSAANVDAIKTGNAYVNIHSGAHPGGELRGQLTP